MLKPGALAMAFALVALPATAEDPAGAWEFRTDIVNKGCTITGYMTIGIEDPGTGERACEFVSSETCGGALPEGIQMQQACEIQFEGDYLLIRSEVLASLTEGRGIDGYLPDNFTVQPSGTGRMSGTWYDLNYADLVEFWRARGGATS
jgi:hypothetical protein